MSTLITLSVSIRYKGTFPHTRILIADHSHGVSSASLDDYIVCKKM